MEEKEADKALLTRGLTRKVTLAEKVYAGAVAALEAAEEAYAVPLRQYYRRCP